MKKFLALLACGLVCIGCTDSTGKQADAEDPSSEASAVSPSTSDSPSPSATATTQTVEPKEKTPITADFEAMTDIGDGLEVGVTAPIDRPESFPDDPMTGELQPDMSRIYASHMIMNSTDAAISWPSDMDLVLISDGDEIEPVTASWWCGTSADTYAEMTEERPLEPGEYCDRVVRADVPAIDGIQARVRHGDETLLVGPDSTTHRNPWQ